LLERAKMLRIDRPGPLHHRLMFFIIRGTQLPQQLFVSRRPTAILRRSGTPSRKTARIACLRVGIHDCFDDDAMLSTAAEIVVKDEMILRTLRERPVTRRSSRGPPGKSGSGVPTIHRARKPCKCESFHPIAVSSAVSLE